MRRSLCLFVLLMLVMTATVSAASTELTEPWHPVREQLLALLSNGERGSYDVWHPAVDELVSGMFEIMLKMAYVQMLEERGASEVNQLLNAVERDSLDPSAYVLEYHPERDWAIVKGPTIAGVNLGLNTGVARHGNEWGVVVPFDADTWRDFDKFADWSSYDPSPNIPAKERSTENQWTVLDDNWRYRNATIQNNPFAPMFVAEVQRTGPAIEAAMFTVTLYDGNNRIVTTGMGNVLRMRQNAIHTVQFLLQGDPSRATHFRIQVDFEM